MSSSKKSPKKKAKSNVSKAAEEQTWSQFDKSDLNVQSTRRKRYQKELIDRRETRKSRLNKEQDPSATDSNLSSKNKTEIERETINTRARDSGPSNTPATRRKNLSLSLNIDDLSSNILASRRDGNKTDKRVNKAIESPTLKKRGEGNIQLADNVAEIDLDNLETRSKNRSTPKTGTERATPRSRRAAARRTKIDIKKEPLNDSTFDKDEEVTTEPREDMARARTPGFNDTPKHLYGLDGTKELSSGEDEICVDSDINNNSPNPQQITKYLYQRPRWNCKCISLSAFVTFIVIAIISALLQPSPPDVPVVQFPERGPIRGQDVTAWDSKDLKELQEKLEQISAQVSGLRHSIKDDAQKKIDDETIMSKKNLVHYIEGLIQDKMEAALDVYSADKLGIPDYALESAGGQIHDHYHSPTYNTGASRKVFGFSLWYDGVPPRVILQPDNTPGSCWAFEGQEGYVVIELSQAIVPDMFTLEHIPSSLSTDQHGRIPTAPKDFSVWGWMDKEGKNREQLGDFTYDDQGKSLQSFKVKEISKMDYKYIELRVSSNHGDPTHTCIYRFRVHGKPSPGPTVEPTECAEP